MHLVPVALMLVACNPTDSVPEDSDTPSDRVSFDDLAFFQAVKVPVRVGDEAVATVDRHAPLIVGRQAILRGLVSTPAGWNGEDVELAVDLTSAGVTRTFRTTADPEDGPIVVPIPADAIGEDSTFAVRLSDEGATDDRFPASGVAPLDARVTGPVAIKLVPFEVNGFVPDTTPAVVEGYRAALMATYPVTDVQITVADVEVWPGALDLGAINVRVGEIQEEAMFAGREDWRVYYYGMATGVATRDEFEGITGTSEGGGGGELYRAYFAAGAAFGDPKSEDTFIHEIGHTHGLLHTPCDGEESTDPDYPYDGGGIGSEGYDFRTGTFVSASDHFDMMSYCFPRWISDYDYAKLATHVANAQDYAGPE